MKLFGHTLSVNRRVVTIFFAIISIHIAVILVYIVYAFQFAVGNPAAPGWTRPTLGREVSDYILEKAVDASVAQDWDSVSLLTTGQEWLVGVFMRIYGGPVR